MRIHTRARSRFHATLLSLVAIAAVATIRDSNDFRIASTTKVDSLEVAGTTDATGIVTARAGVRLTTPTTGPLFTSGSGIPAGTATIGSLYLRTDTAQIYQNTDGASTWAEIGSGGSSFSGASAYNSGNQATSTSTETAATYDTESYDTDSYHSAVNPTRMTVPAVGQYAITAGVQFAASSTGHRGLTIRKNGTTYLGFVNRNATTSPDTSATIIAITALLAAGDYVEVMATQSSGGALNIVGAEYNSFSITKLTGGAGGGGSVSAEATITVAARPASVVLTTEGTVDWLYMPFVNPSQTAANSLYASLNGGWLAKSFAWKPGASATQTSEAHGTTYTATVAGSQSPLALNTTLAATWHNNSGTTATDGGWTFRAPMRASGQRRVRIYAWHRSSTLTVTARASDGSMTPVTDANVATSPEAYMIEIVYSGSPGVELIVTAETSAGTAAFPAFSVGAITVADI